ncbi:MAK21 [Candida pseudojiufengensis]|uniref:MAK21 n=1 Tax=Candida pseudojiufengensis TaxID=497109 RepID=UPI0022242A8C|nr:MAK21 [Candida pseudojiufengensis]KAI5959129.1 MAK21 [Candida pseudojiufengensis]
MSSILNLSGLKDKITNKLSQQKPNKKEKKQEQQKIKKQQEPSKDQSTITKTNNSKSKSKSNKDSITISKNNRKQNKVTDEILRREALELGATEEDLKLLEDLDENDDDQSEIEINDDDETNSKVDSSLNGDLSKFMKDIGLGNGEAVIVDEEELEDEDEVDGEEVAEEEAEEEIDANEEEEYTSFSESDEELEDEEEEEEEEEEEVPDLVYDNPSNTNNKDDEVIVKEAKIEKDKPKKPTISSNEDEITDFTTVSSDKLIVPNQLEWYNIYQIPSEQPPKLDRFARERLLEKATSTLDKDNKTYLKEFSSDSSQRKFLSQILSDGTLNDKISALTLLIQEAPLHNLKALDTLVGYCDKKSRNAALQSINAFKDLLLNGLLPDRKLLAFDKQPLTKDAQDGQLAVYLFEDHLKKAYFKLIVILEKLLQDPIVHVRMNALNHVFDLLKSKPEQEVNLLKLGVNKLGDTDNKVSAKASYLILQLEQEHPAMKKIITDSVIDVIFKSNNDDHSKYYGVLTLNQTIITRKEEELANSLVKTYFALFEKVLIESNTLIKEELKDKTIGESEKGRKNNRKNFKKGKKGGKSIKKQDKSDQEIIEEKNSKMFSALLTGLNRSFPFSNLPNEIFQQHLNTLFKITHSSNFNTAIQALILINHIVTQQNLNSDRYYKTLYESLLDSRLVMTSKQGIYLNLLYKSLKNDKSNIPRILAFVKRILQVIAHWLNIGAIAGMLYLLNELSKTIPEISDLLIDINSRPDEIDKTTVESETKTIENTDSTITTLKEEEEYDPKKRDPKFANANKSSLWEINLFLEHYHPTVEIYAQSFIDNDNTSQQQQKPDLGLYTLSHFLDRFVYKNAKLKPQIKGSSIMQPLGGIHTGNLLVKSTNFLNKDLPVNTENWVNKNINDIKADEKFFHQYFTTKVNKLKNKKETGEIDEDVDIDDDQEEDENGMGDDEVWNALVKSRPDVEDDLSDGGFSDFDEDDFSDLDDDDEEVKDEDEDDEFDDGEGPLQSEEINEFDMPLGGEDANDDEIDEDDEDDEELDIFNINEDDELSDSEFEAEEIDEDDEEEIKKTDKNQPTKSKKRSNPDDNSNNNKKKTKRQRIKDLPLFAPAEDYE